MENKKRENTISAKVVNLTSGQNTIKVQVERVIRHPMYERQIKQHKNYLVDIAEGKKTELSIGDIVIIKEVKPISKTKNWTYVQKK